MKCLLILGVPEERFKSADFCLHQHESEVLALDIQTHSTGETVFACLETLSARVGVPLGVVSDLGGDVKKGIE